LTGVGEYIFSRNALKAASALATVCILLTIGLRFFYFGPRDFQPMVVATRGPVEIYSSARERWVPAKPGITINKNDSIRLASLAQVDLASKKLYKIRIKQNSEVDFIRLAKSYDDLTDISVKKGKIMLKTTPGFKGSSINITTPASKTEVLGTALMVDVSPVSGNTWVGVLKGRVAVEGLGISLDKKHLNRVLVEEGKKTLIRPGDVPTVPEIFSDREWQMMDEMYRIGDLPQVAIMVGTDSQRVERLLAPAMLFFYDDKPRTLPKEFEKIVLDIEKAVVEKDMKLHKESADRLNSLVKRYPNPKYDVQFLLFLGGYYYFLDDYKSSTELFNTLIDGYPDSTLISLAICAKAVIYDRNLLNPNKAKQLYQDILDFYPNSPEADYAKDALKRLSN